MIEVLDKIVIAIGGATAVGLFLLLVYFLYEFAVRDPFAFCAFFGIVVLLSCLLRFFLWADIS
jgi:hypothetical protein